MTGIKNIVSQRDLLGRSVLVNMPPIPEDKKIDETTLWEEFNKAHPCILGAFLDAVVMALRNLPTTKLPKRPRLVDFALWVTAAEPALGLKKGSLWKRIRQTGIRQIRLLWRHRLLES